MSSFGSVFDVPSVQSAGLLDSLDEVWKTLVSALPTPSETVGWVRTLPQSRLPAPATKSPSISKPSMVAAKAVDVSRFGTHITIKRRLRTSASTRRTVKTVETIGHPCRIDSVPRSVSPVAPRDRAQSSRQVTGCNRSRIEAPPGAAEIPPATATKVRVRGTSGQTDGQGYVWFRSARPKT